MAVASAPPLADLDRALAGLEWTLVDTGLTALRSGERVDLPAQAAGFSYVSTGRVRVSAEDGPTATLDAGDLVFFPRPHARRLVAETGAEVLHASFASHPGLRGVVDAFPAAVVAHRFAEREPNMVALVEGMRSGPVHRPGDAVICSRIASTIAAVAVRQWAELGCAPRGWLGAAGDPDIRRVLDALHADLDRPWTVSDLARVGMMSRSAFASRFREVVGLSPASYLAASRVDSGMELLRRGELTVTQIAAQLGYGSEEGFSRAFRRHTGRTPVIWRADQAASAAASLVG